MVFGVYEPGHLRHAMHYVNNGIATPGSMWDFYLIGDYGLTATEPIATNGMEIAHEVGRPIATQAEARAMYQIS